MTDVTQRSFKRGATEAKEAAKSTGGFVRRIGFFPTMNDNDIVYGRFLTDASEWMTADYHNFYPTKPAPANYKGTNWPQTMGPVCRRTKMGDGLPLFDDCYCCDHPVMSKWGKMSKPQARTSAIMVLREPVMGDGSDKRGGPTMTGKRVGFKDKTKEITYKKDGNDVTEKVKDIVIVTKAWSNFYSALEGAAQVYGTILDRDFAITVSNAGTKDVDFKSIGLEATPQHDLRDPEVAKKYGITITSEIDEDGNPIKVWPPEMDLALIVFAQADIDFYARFIDPALTPKDNGDSEEHLPVSTQTNDVETKKLADMAARILAIPTPQAPADPKPPTGSIGNYDDDE
jgi:hypothetical protein